MTPTELAVKQVGAQNAIFIFMRSEVWIKSRCCAMSGPFIGAEWKWHDLGFTVLALLHRFNTVDDNNIQSRSDKWQLATFGALTGLKKQNSRFDLCVVFFYDLFIPRRRNNFNMMPFSSFVFRTTIKEKEQPPLVNVHRGDKGNVSHRVREDLVAHQFYKSTWKVKS